MPTLDDLVARAKTAKTPLRAVLPADPSEMECKILMSVVWHAALLESQGKRGDLAAYAGRLRRELLRIEEALR